MILDLENFIDRERPHWDALDTQLKRLQDDSAKVLSFEEIQHLQYLYERASSDLTRMRTFSSEEHTIRYLEDLVGRAYSEINENRSAGLFKGIWTLITEEFPQAFRDCRIARRLSLTLFVVGILFGALSILLDPMAKRVILPEQFSHLAITPEERVAREEKGEGNKGDIAELATFSTYLMTHNTRVSIYTMSLGVTWGVGTGIMAFYNSVILGAIGAEYISAGKAVFLLAWLLPHGSVELPSLIIASQAGLVLGGALIGWGQPVTLRQRLRAVRRQLLALIVGVGFLLIYAGLVEAFISQFHEPVLPYWIKITLGVVNLTLLTLFLTRAGQKKVSK
ncbi:MAG: stage II sporulation protein M [Verrucomicrobiota bacterium]|nr:stage II sporulation protein M [Verrucomicrobiota bacterium]